MTKALLGVDLGAATDMGAGFIKQEIC